MQRKYRVRAHPHRTGRWLAEYSYLGLIWSSVDTECYGWDPVAVTYNGTTGAEQAIDKDIKDRKRLHDHRAKGSYRYP